MKKIVMYIDSMCKGGAQRVMLNLADYFVSQNIEIVLINDFICDKDKEYIVSDKVRRIYLRSSLKGNAILKNIERIYKLRKVVRSEEPDIVLSFLGHPNLRMLISTVGLRCKKIVSVRNDPRKEYGVSKINRTIAGLLFYLADGCVFQTREAAEYFPQNVRNRSKIILNPVSDVFYDIELEPQRKNIISVGRLENQKNQLLLMRAFSLIADEFPDENLIIYGEGHLRRILEKEIKNLGLGKRVFLPGEVKDVAKELAKAEIFVLSSDYEGMPNALLEAMAVGLPCISTDCPCGGPKEVIINNINGILIACGDSKKMAFAIKNLLTNREKKKELEVNAKIMAEKYRAKNIYSLWNNYFTSILS